MNKGRFIVLYGPNNLGKSTQMDLLEEVWQEMERPYVRLKYPVYDLEPTGPIINSVLRKGVKMADEDLQFLFAQNRRDFEPQVRWYLDNDIDVLSEDYVGTGKAWGLTKGVSRELLEEYNRGLLVPDVEIFMDGERFLTGIEKGHRHEGGGDWERNREIHRQLCEEYGWKRIDAAGTKQEVNLRILQTIFEVKNEK